MKKQEAYQALGLESTATQEEVKKTFKKLAAKYHPDVNKDADAIDNFKKINSAYQAIDSNKFDDQFQGGGFQGGFQGSVNFADFFNGFANQHANGGTRTVIVEDIYLDATLSFKESIIGTERNLTFKRKVRCNSCQGNGKINKSNGCATCSGSGRVFNRTNNGMIGTVCHVCRGARNTEDCTTCKTEGSVDSESTVSVKIPAGVFDSAVLHLQGMGNYAGGFLGYSNAFLKINVTPAPGLSLAEQDVLSSVDISLLEAFQGAKRTINTIDGNKEIDIPKLIKNKEEIILPKLGVNRSGKQRVIVNVNYPSDIEKLIGVLTEEQK